MIHQILSVLSEQYSGEAAKAHVADISRFHRIQASPGFRQAAAFVHGTLEKAGVAVETISLAGDGKTFYWSQLTPPEWDAEEAELWLASPDGNRERLADFRECKISLIQRSSPTAADGVETDLVVLNDGTEEEHYAGIDVTGRIVLTSSTDLRRVRDLAVARFGAVGILYDGMADAAPIRTRIDLPDARQYVSFWPTGQEPVPCWGFSLTPRIGDRLRKLSREAQPGSGVRLWARVKSHFVPNGHMEVVTATIPGETDEEVWVVAHLCHPQPSANDNASGAGATMELALTLRSLIATGKLPTPRRALRFLWLPEISGTFAYLATHPDEMARAVSAVNLDMVGQNQDQCGSSFLVERLPRALPSFADDLIVRIQEELARGSKSHSGQGEFALFRHAVTPFSGGSDHYILSDPTVGIPCPMIIQWPDRYYHTSLDTIDRVDPASLHRAGVLAGTYAFFLASAGLAEVEWLGHEMLARFKRSSVGVIQDAYTDTVEKRATGSQPGAHSDLLRRIEWDLRWEVAALASLRRLAPGFDVEPMQKAAQRFVHSETSTVAAWPAVTPRPVPDASGSEWHVAAASIVPVRTMRGPAVLLGYLPQLSPAEKEEWRVFVRGHKAHFNVLTDLALYWCDGKRSLLQIADEVEMETGQRVDDVLLKYFQLLRRVGLVRWAEEKRE